MLMRRARALVLALGVLLLPACGSGSEDSATIDRPADASGTVDLDETEVGSSVSLEATVTTVLSPGAFEIRAEDTATADPVLVLNEEDVLEAGQIVQIAGIVRLFDAETMAEAYGLASSAGLAEREGELVIVASEVDTDVRGDGT